MKQIAAATVVGALVAALVSACAGGGPTSPTAPFSVNVTHSPAVGATVANNSAYDIRIDVSGDRGHYFTTMAFVRDDGVYSQPAMCAETDAGSGGGSGGLGFGQTHEVRKTIDRLNFAVGRRVNLVVLFSSGGGCDVGPSAPTVDPSQADLGRQDVTLNWLVGGAD